MRSFVLGAITALALAGGADDTRAGEPASPEAQHQLTILKLRVRKYVEATWTFTSQCPSCAGAGCTTRLVNLAGGETRIEQTPCGGCKHTGSVTDTEAIRRWAAAYRSPTWRAQDDVRKATDEIVTAYVSTQGHSVAPAGATVWSAELLDAGHAEVVLRGEGCILVQLRWTRSTDPKNAGQPWWLWTKGIDGPWPGDPTSVLPAASFDLTRDALSSALEPLAAEGSKSLGDRLAIEGVKASLVAAHRTGAWVVLTLRNDGVSSECELQRSVARDLVPACRAALAVDSATIRVSLRFLATYRDDLGAMKPRVYATAGITRTEYDKIRFDRLEPAVIGCLFSHVRVPHDDGKVWFQE